MKSSNWRLAFFFDMHLYVLHLNAIIAEARGCLKHGNFHSKIYSHDSILRLL